MNLKIISDGTTSGTKLINEETSETIGLVQNIKWEIDAHNAFATATVILAKIPVEMSINNAEVYEVESID